MKRGRKRRMAGKCWGIMAWLCLLILLAFPLYAKAVGFEGTAAVGEVAGGSLEGTVGEVAGGSLEGTAGDGGTGSLEGTAGEVAGGSLEGTAGDGGTGSLEGTAGEVASGSLDGMLGDGAGGKWKEESDLQYGDESNSDKGQYLEIWDAAGLRAMEAAPEECYRLMTDIDMDGEDWFPFAFRGELDGNGCAILNLSVTCTGESIRETFDGNMKVYDTYFSGFFDELDGARVANLSLVNLRIRVETDQPCFIGGFAGYMEGSSIESCSVQGRLELRAHDRMFGVGGMIGYGCGAILDSAADVSLLCIDTDAGTRDEQFMGGVCAAGYPDINRCTVNISGFDSDHGYVHDGGLVGMYMFYPKGMKYKGSITDNRVTGKITFFEDNKNRRAYCNGFIGEIMNWDFENGRNKDQFTRDEIFQYDRELLPHDCGNPVMSETVTLPSHAFGFTTYLCETCGYTETDHYTLKSHTYAWEVIREPSETEEGIRLGTCTECGAKARENIPKLEPVQTKAPDMENQGSNKEDQGTDAQLQSVGKQDREYGDESVGERVWTVPKVGKGRTLLYAVLISLAVFGTMWIIIRRGR